MKKIFFLCVIGFSLFACGDDSEEKQPEKPKDVSQSPEYKNGLELATKSNCFTCHDIDNKLTGPPYREIANKYAAAPDTIVSHLAGKIISGGSGVWGNIPMIPHPDLSKADAETIVRYILLLKK